MYLFSDPVTYIYIFAPKVFATHILALSGTDVLCFIRKQTDSQFCFHSRFWGNRFLDSQNLQAPYTLCVISVESSYA